MKNKRGFYAITKENEVYSIQYFNGITFTEFLTLRSQGDWIIHTSVGYKTPRIFNTKSDYKIEYLGE
jgi:hypothetical protein